MFRISVCVCAFFLLACCILPMDAQQPAAAPANVAVPPMVNFSGLLTDVNGKPRTGIVGVIFSLYQESQGGAPLWTETQNVQADKAGHYTAALGSTSSEGLPAHVFANGEARWLGVQVQGQVEQPRVLLLSVPYALKALDAETIGGKPASSFMLAPRGGASASANNLPPGVITGSGTKNVVPRFTGATTIGNSDIFETTTGNVGIGATTPGSKLTVRTSSPVAIHGVTQSPSVIGQTGGTQAIWGDSSLTPAIVGSSDCCTAVGGSSGNYYGVEAFSANYTAMFGWTEGSGHGVEGLATSASSSDALHGETFGSTGSGAAGISHAGNVGVYGSVDNCSTGSQCLAARFDGDETVNGNVFINGTLFAAAKFFRIDHPLDPANRYLNHDAIESSEMKNLYDGVAVLDANGSASVELPKWFEALNGDFRYQLTCIGGFAPIYIAEEIKNEHFTIAGGRSGMRVSWQVTGVRHDAYAKAHPLRVEVEKTGKERGHYLHPKLYGAPAEQQVDWGRYPEFMKAQRDMQSDRKSGAPQIQPSWSPQAPALKP